jgi:para-aminobenzoate synthetase component 1
MSSVHLLQQLREKASAWVASFEVGILLDSNDLPQPLHLQRYAFIAAAGVKHQCLASEDAFAKLERFKQEHHTEWLLGWLGYDLKNQIEKLSSNHPDKIGFPECYLFVPQKLIVVNWDGEVVLGEEWLAEVLNFSSTEKAHLPITLQQRVSKEKYIQNVEHIRHHIEEGDVYELNYCVEFFAENASINPVQIYQRLRKRSAVPFGAFIKHHHLYLMGASPERFITKRGQQLYSQPIKGTAKRGATAAEDEQHKQDLLASEKERAENLMIVDLVRNDLAHTAQTGSIKVEELFGLYTFPQVHQMISTVSSTLKEGTPIFEAIRCAFPMGSMTGAPKIMAMELIEQYEQTKRGLYSGAIGYFSPDGDMDLNVVIRSIQYNAQTGYLNFEVGSAITYDSVAEHEYEECLLKAKAMMEVLAE